MTKITKLKDNQTTNKRTKYAHKDTKEIIKMVQIFKIGV